MIGVRTTARAIPPPRERGAAAELHWTERRRDGSKTAPSEGRKHEHEHEHASARRRGGTSRREASGRPRTHTSTPREVTCDGAKDLRQSSMMPRRTRSPAVTPRARQGQGVEAGKTQPPPSGARRSLPPRTPVPPSLTARVVENGILLAAMKVFARRGFTATRVEDVLEEAGVARRTFYRYFTSKEDALAAVYELATGELLGALDEASAAVESPLSGVGAGVDLYLDFHVENAALFRVLVEQSVRSDSPLAGHRRQFRARILEGSRPGGRDARCRAARWLHLRGARLCARRRGARAARGGRLGERRRACEEGDARAGRERSRRPVNAGTRRRCSIGRGAACRSWKADTRCIARATPCAGLRWALVESGA